MEVKKRCPVLPLILGRGRLNLSQCALDRSLSVDLSHSLSPSLSLPPLSKQEEEKETIKKSRVWLAITPQRGH